MLYHNRAALLLALTPILACRMLYISGEQADSSANGPSSDTLGLTSNDSLTGAGSSIYTTSLESGGTLMVDETGVSATTGSKETTASNDTSTSGATSGVAGDETSSSSGPDDLGCNNNGVLDKGEECDDGEKYNSNTANAFCTKKCRRNGLLVFVTSKSDFNGRIEYEGIPWGVPAAKIHCSEMAKKIPELEDMTLDPTFFPWIGTAAYSPAQSFDRNCDKPYFLPRADGSPRILVANDFEDIITPKSKWDIYLRKPISLTESGESIPFTASVLTGVLPNGEAAAGGDCSGFTSTGGNIRKGSAAFNIIWWTDYFNGPCNIKGHLYCFEQCPP